jgi:hypothetical protein
MAPPGSNEWLKEHGISRELWDARPYVRYGPPPYDGYSAPTYNPTSEENLEPVREEYKTLPRAQRDFAIDVARGGRDPYRSERREKEGFTTEGGFLIKRHNPPGIDEALEHKDIYAEFRPDEPIATENLEWHYHGAREPKWNPAWTRKWKKVKDEKVPRNGRWGDGPDDWWPVFPPEAGEKKVGRPLPWPAVKQVFRREKGADGRPVGPKLWQPLRTMADHIDRGKYEDDHDGKNTNKVHCHQGIAKYCFVSTPRKPVSVEKEPGKFEIERRKDKNRNIAKRLDMHPMMAAKRLGKAKHIVFVIEGCIKADSVLTWLIENGWDDWTVVSVPSVTLWQTPGLDYFLNMHKDKRFYIVPDADGFRDDEPNKNVVSQATMLRTKIRRLRIEAAIFSPPFDPSDLDEKNKPNLNGVDDFLGKGGRPLTDLVARGRLEAFDTEGWMEAHPRPDLEKKQYKPTIRRNAAVIEAIGLHSGDGIHYKGTLQSLERIAWLRDTTKPPPSMVTYLDIEEALNRPPDYLSPGRQRIRDALDDLKAIGAIDYDEEQVAKLKRDPRADSADFVEPAVFTILVKELQTTPLPQITLGQHLAGEKLIAQVPSAEPLTTEEIQQIDDSSEAVAEKIGATNISAEILREQLGIAD